MPRFLAGRWELYGEVLACEHADPRAVQAWARDVWAAREPHHPTVRA